jgi:pimeloyl-ACP methyl ester carboxylesterase
MAEKYVRANGIRLAYEEFGDPSHPAIILMMGLGTQLIGWPVAMCEGLVDRGFRVIRFDNRDIGLSEKMENAHIPQAAVLASGSRVRLLKHITTPTLVIHGRDDALVSVAGGIDTARHIHGAKLEIFDGMGHDLPKALQPDFIELIATHAKESQAAEARAA